MLNGQKDIPTDAKETYLNNWTIEYLFCDHSLQTEYRRLLQWMFWKTAQFDFYSDF